MALLNIARITFLANDPYFGSGLLAGDVMNTYWESTDGTFTVTKNGASYPQAGSGRIEVTNDLAGRFDLSYRTVTMILPQYCVGLNLWTFSFRKSGDITGRTNGTNDWPYVEALEFPNSNVCAVAPAANDLAWIGRRPLITNASSPTTQDGSVTYTASSSNGQVLYALTAATGKLPNFNNSTGIFTNLTAGAYKIWTRDAAWFMLSYTFDIKDLSAGLPPPPIELPSVAFVGSPTIAQDTGPGDGSITYTATSNNPPIEYALRFFAYGDGNGQASSTFSNLRFGNYVLYACDSVGAITTYSFAVPLNGTPLTPPATPPNYDVKYQLQVTDYSGKQSVVNILKNGYEGAVTQVDGGSEDPLVYSVRLYGNSDKYSPIMASTVTVMINSATPFQFQELFTASQDDYRILYYQQGVLKMAGKIYPQSYFEPYTESTNYPVTITATDGLVELDELDFVDDQGNYITGKASQIEVIALILQKLKYNIGIRCACNLYATGMASTAADDPLDQAYVDCRSYYQKDEPLSCLEVLKRILEPYCASICQWEGFWWIVRFEEFVSTAVPYREYDYTGDYRNNGTHDPVVNIKRTTEPARLHWTAGVGMDMVMPYGNVEVIYRQGLQKSLLKNGDFRITYNIDNQGVKKASVDLSDFAFVNNQDTYMQTMFTKIDSSDEDDKNGALQFTGTGKAYIMTRVPSFYMTGGDRLTMLLKVKLGASPLVDFPYQKVKIMVKHGTQYLQQDGNWTATESLIVHYVKEAGKYIELKTLGNTSSVGTATLEIRVYSSYVFDPEYTTVAALRAKPTVDLPTGYRTDLALTMPPTVGNILFYELENNISAESVYDIIRPTDYNAGTNPYQWVLKKAVEYSVFMPTQGTITIDEIRLNYSPGVELIDRYTENLVPGNVKNKLTKTIYHGSATKETKSIFAVVDSGFLNVQELWVSNQNFALTHINYLRSSVGTPYQKWKRDAVLEDHTLQQIVMRSYAAQYKSPSRRLTGSLSNKPVAGDPVYLTPISILKENYDGKYYKPMGFSYHVRMCLYDGEFIELVDITNGGTSTTGGISSFNSAFNSSFGS